MEKINFNNLLMVIRRMRKMAKFKVGDLHFEFKRKCQTKPDNLYQPLQTK
jgi:hypothetical protein